MMDNMDSKFVKDSIGLDVTTTNQVVIQKTIETYERAAMPSKAGDLVGGLLAGAEVEHLDVPEHGAGVHELLVAGEGAGGQHVVLPVLAARAVTLHLTTNQR